MTRAARAIKLLLVALAAFTGLAGVAAAVAVRQVPAGHRLSVEGDIHEDGLVLAPLWAEVEVLPPADPPKIEAPAVPPAENPRGALEARLEKARADLTAAEEAAASRIRASGAAFADIERAHRDDLTAMRVEFEGRIAALEAEATHLPAARMAEAEVEATGLLSEGRRALAEAEASRDRLMAEALTGEAARYAIAIEAARHFELGDIHLPDPPPDFLRTLGSMESWRRFFLGRP